MLNIVNPALGKTWLDKLLSIHQDNNTKQVTLEKLNYIAVAQVSNTVKVNYLQQLLDLCDEKKMRGLGMSSSQDKEWVRYLHLDVYWKQVFLILSVHF